MREITSVIQGVVDVAQRYGCYTGAFRHDLESLQSSVNYASPELLQSPVFFWRLSELLTTHYPLVKPISECQSAMLAVVKGIGSKNV